MNTLRKNRENIILSVFVKVQFVQRHHLRRLDWMVLIVDGTPPCGTLDNISAQQALSSSAHYFSPPRLLILVH